MIRWSRSATSYGFSRSTSTSRPRTAKPALLYDHIAPGGKSCGASCSTPRNFSTQSSPTPVSVKMSPSKPDVWVSSWRTVMTLAASLSPISNSGRYVRTVASRSTLPSSTSCSTSELVQSLVIDPIWNTESVVASTSVDMLNSPAA